MSKGSCIEFDCDEIAYGNGKCKSHYMKEYRQKVKNPDYIPVRGERLNRKDYESIDPEELWAFVKKELRIG